MYVVRVYIMHMLCCVLWAWIIEQLKWWDDLIKTNIFWLVCEMREWNWIDIETEFVARTSNFMPCFMRSATFQFFRSYLKSIVLEYNAWARRIFMNEHIQSVRFFSFILCCFLNHTLKVEQQNDLFCCGALDWLTLSSLWVNFNCFNHCVRYL